MFSMFDYFLQGYFMASLNYCSSQWLIRLILHDPGVTRIWRCSDSCLTNNIEHSNPVFCLNFLDKEFFPW